MSPIFDSIDQLISSVLFYRKEEEHRCDVNHIPLLSACFCLCEMHHNVDAENKVC
ncbi:hypothetical protein BRO54_2255 [Geobacillus proteiniphilus]|uniref:Uncharacterized protein n=1 Tax=Geobacillus proteiniphilus TaxID=860353 RepID=A0A1Q5SXY9_9BACL|nr:hypothetical protein BRO54_2255 [Geobacillus proteiniphilus]